MNKTGLLISCLSSLSLIIPAWHPKIPHKTSIDPANIPIITNHRMTLQLWPLGIEGRCNVLQPLPNRNPRLRCVWLRPAVSETSTPHPLLCRHETKVMLKDVKIKPLEKLCCNVTTHKWTMPHRFMSVGFLSLSQSRNVDQSLDGFHGSFPT